MDITALGSSWPSPVVLFGLFHNNNESVTILYLYCRWQEPHHHAALWGNNSVSSFIHSGTGLLPHKTVWLYNYQLNPSLLSPFKKKFLFLIVVGSNSLCWNFWKFACQAYIFHNRYLLLFFFFLTLQVLYTAKSQELSYIVKGLKPYRIYNFTISLCNSVGCVTSASEAGQTLASGKQVLADVKNILCVYKENTYKTQWCL